MGCQFRAHCVCRVLRYLHQFDAHLRRLTAVDCIGVVQRSIRAAVNVSLRRRRLRQRAVWSVPPLGMGNCDAHRGRPYASLTAESMSACTALPSAVVLRRRRRVACGLVSAVARHASREGYRSRVVPSVKGDNVIVAATAIMAKHR